MRNDIFDVGIIGAGQIVTDSHLPALLTSDQVRVSWVADPDGHRARLVGRSFGISSISKFRGVHELPPADVVLLAAPYGARTGMYPALASRYRAVYVEKPFALTVQEHDEQCALFDLGSLACGYQRRSLAGTQSLRNIIRSNLFGELRGISIEFGGLGVKTAGRYSGNLAMAGGGILFEAGVHGLDAALYMTDAVGIEAKSVRMRTKDGFDLHTEATLLIQQACGAKIPMELTVTSLQHASNMHLFEFDHGTIQFDLFGNAAIRVQGRTVEASFVLTNEVVNYPRTSNQVFHEHWRLFFEGIRARADNATSARATRVTTEAIEQLYKRGFSQE